MINVEVDTSGFKQGFSQYKKKRKKAHPDAMLAAGKIFLAYVDKGLGASVSPPILTGALRGSAAIHVKGVFKYSLKDDYPEGTPNESNIISLGDFFRKGDVVTISYNTPYAARWHENPFTPGPVSQTYPFVGDKYLEKHLSEDGDKAFEAYAEKMKKELEG